MIVFIDKIERYIRLNMGFEEANGEFERLEKEYFDGFNYILGDWAYGKLRLKGFNDKDNKNFKNINDIKNVEEYIEKYCAYGCRYFILKKVENK